VPQHLRDKGGQANKRAGHGKGYAYSHDFPEGVSGQNYMERPLTLYTPKTVGAESAIAERLGRWRGLKAALSGRTGKLAGAGPAP
jgi:putative ATPase